MVNVVGNSFQGYNRNHYIELNHQLAKELAEARQQNGQAAQVITEQKEELHRKEEHILDLKQQIKELTRYKDKCKVIEKVILSKSPVECLPVGHIRAIEAAPTQQQEVLSLPGPQEESSCQANDVTASSPDCVDDENDDASVSTRDAAETADRLSDQPLHRISEEEEEEEHTKEQSNKMDRSSQSQTISDLSQSSTLKSIAPTLTESGLDPPYPNTYVPPIDNSDRSIRTCSVYNILDQIDETPTKSAERYPESPKLRELNSNTISSTHSTASSPIHPINAKTNNNNVSRLGDVFHSTPVLSQKNPLVRNIQLTDIEQSQTSEYWGTQNFNNHPEQPQPQQQQQQQQTNQSIHEQQPSQQNDQAPRRYNLRKRTKKC